MRVTHYSERRIADRDNLLKPIQDALQGVVYVDDKRIKDRVAHVDAALAAPSEEDVQGMLALCEQMRGCSKRGVRVGWVRAGPPSPSCRGRRARGAG